MDPTPCQFLLPSKPPGGSDRGHGGQGSQGHIFALAARRGGKVPLASSLGGKVEWGKLLKHRRSVQKMLTNLCVQNYDNCDCHKTTKGRILMSNGYYWASDNCKSL